MLKKLTTCPQCGRSFRLDEQLAGRRARCGACARAFIVSFVDGPARRGPPLPIVRLNPRFMRLEVVAIYDDHILMGDVPTWESQRVNGRLRARKLRMTEDMCHEAGEPALRAQLDHVRSEEFGCMEEIREVIAGRFGMRRESGARKITVRAEGRPARTFSLAGAQAATPCAVLSARLAEHSPGARYVTAVGTADMLGWATGLLGGGALAGLGLVQSLRHDGPLLLGLAAGLSASMLVATAAWFLIWRARIRKESRPEPGGKSVHSIKPAARRRRPPIRSAALGWLLKVLGVVYWIVIASPLTDGWSGLPQGSWLLIWAPAPLLLLAGYRMCQRPCESTRGADSRKSILYLRPFKDDFGTTLQPPGWLGGITGVRADQGNQAAANSHTTFMNLAMQSHPVRLLRMICNYGVSTAEESLVRYFETHAPVVAIGKPGEALATPGAARIYLDDSRWQSAVLSELENVEAVVMEPGPSAGVHWELEQIRARVDPRRVLLSLAGYWKDPQAYEGLLVACREVLGVQLPRVVPFLDRPAFVCFAADWTPRLLKLRYKCPVFWAILGDAADLESSLQPFLRGMPGGDTRPLPATRPASEPQVLAAAGAAMIVGVAVALAPVYAVKWAGGYALGHYVLSPEARRIERSARITLKGTAVPYEVVVPEALMEQLPPAWEQLLGMGVAPTDGHEYLRQSADSRFALEVFASTLPEDISGIAQLRIDANKAHCTSEPRLESSRTFEHAGVEWSEVKVSGEIGPVTGLETTWITSGPHGTAMFIVGQCLSGDATRTDDFYRSITDEILQSIRLAPPGEH